jgi:hypothetical protein
MGHIDRTQKFTRLVDADLGFRALGDAVLDAAHGSEGIERDRVARHEPVEKVAQRRQSLVFCGRGNCELADILTGQARSDFAEFDALLLAPGEEPRHGAAIGALRVGVIDRRIEKLVGSEDRVRSSPNQNLGYWPHRHT